MISAPAYPVTVVDATGAGDSLAGAVIYGYLAGLPLPEFGKLANATGAAKVQKRGTGHNVPTRDEVAAVLARFGEQKLLLTPGSARPCSACSPTRPRPRGSQTGPRGVGR